MTVQTELYTLEEFEQLINLPENQDRLLELINGEIFEKMPTEEHGSIAGWIITFLNIYLMEHALGEATVEARHQLRRDKKNSLLPDVSFIKGARELVSEGSVPQMPDLAVEIKSPKDTYRGMRKKAEYYIENGSQLVWLIFPGKQLVEVYRPDADSEILTTEDVLTGDQVLPGFELPIEKIFRKKKVAEG